MRRVGLGCIALSLCLALGAPALAQRPPRGAGVAESLADQAMRAYKSGEHDRAIELYLAAFAQAPDEVVLLYNAARVAHSGKRYDRAEGLYRRVLDHAACDEARRQTVEGYLVALRRARADDSAAAGRSHAAAGRHAAAADAFRAAHRDEPERIDHLLAAARAARLAGDNMLAQRDYRAFLAVAPAGTDRADAEAELRALEAKLAAQATARPPAAAVEPPAAATPTAAPPPTTTPGTATTSGGALSLRHAAASVAPPRWTWVATLGGAAALAAGAGWVAWAHGQTTALQDAVAPGKPPTWTWDAAQARGRALEGHTRAGYAVAGVGLASLAVGAFWRWGRSPDANVAWIPRAGGGQLDVQLSF